MKIVVAPNSFKDCLSSAQIARAMEEGVKSFMPDAEIVKIPLSDGGDGFHDVISENYDTDTFRIHVSDPLGRKIESHYSMIKNGKTAFMEMALASGLALLTGQERNPLLASSKGTGEMILSAINHGAEKVILGIGGSATCDGGIGASYALGCRFYDLNGKELYPSGENMINIKRIDTAQIPEKVRNTAMTLICDVENPLLGENGAAKVYAPQKGASMRQVELLEQGLANLADIIETAYGVDLRRFRGSGAAGGIAVGLKAFFNTELKRGTELIFDLLDFDEKINGASLILTGEGRIDEQTVFGKVPAEVAKFAKRHHAPCIAICGSVSGNMNALFEAGMSSVHSICSGPCNLEEAIRNAPELIMLETERVFRTFLAGTRIHISGDKKRGNDQEIF